MDTRKDRIMNKINKTKANLTDLSSIYSRPLDFKDHDIIFDYKNEYSNSLGYVQLHGTEEIRSLLQKQLTLEILNEKASTVTAETDVNEKKMSKKYLRQLVNIGFDSTPATVSTSTNSLLYCDEILLPSVATEQDDPSENEFEPYANSDDSRDADYLPDFEEESVNSDDDNVITNDPSQSFPVSKSKTNDYMDALSQPAFQHCEFASCKLHVFACCENCFCLLCSTHYDCRTPFNDCKNHRPYTTENVTEKLKISKKVRKGKVDKENNSNLANKQLEEKKGERNIIKGSVQQVNNDKTRRDVNNACCEYKNCQEEVFASCGKCLSLLCFDHFHDEISYNDCTQHEPYSQDNTNLTPKYPSQASTPNVLNASACGDENTQDTEIVNTTQSIGKGLTKDGKVRKRRKFEESIQVRKAKKIKLEIEKLYIKEPCTEKCIKKCTSNFSEEQRIKIHNEYISLSWESRGLFMKSLVDTKNTATRKTNTKSGQDTPRRDVTYKYFFCLRKEKTEVCKTFFLSTLGYNPKNDRRLHLALKRSADRQKDERGKGLRANVIDKDIIKAHIRSYNPSISHYRREHAPLRLYLPSDITIASMYKHFCETHSNLTVSYEMYRLVLRKDMNISFAHLGNEECEVCAHFKEHASETENNSQTSCLFCQKYEKHKLDYQNSRKEYKKDVKRASDANTNDTCFYSVDLQKVIMLPRMEQYKAGIFCPRIIVYNESFVPLGPSNNDNIPFPVVWNESVSGRKQEDIISAMRAFLMYKRDKRHIVLWMDNCSAQNKNWAMLSFLIQIINSNLIAAETITLKYFEPGHTFMSADSYHHRVEQSMQKKGKVYDFNDFVDAVKNAQKPSEVKVMAVSDFYEYADLSSQHRLRKLTPRVYLRNIVVIVARRGLYTLDFKTDNNQDVDETLDFIQIKYIKSNHLPEVKQRSVLRGVKESTKNDIKEKLLHLMPKNRRQFWLDLPLSSGTGGDDLE